MGVEPPQPPSRDPVALRDPVSTPGDPTLEPANERAALTTEKPSARSDAQGAATAWPPDDDLELEQAIRDHRASFVQYVDVWYFSDPEFNRNGEASARRYRKYYRGIFEAFTAAEGHVVASYFCNGVPAAAALTAKSPRFLLFRMPEELTLHIVDNAPRDAETDSRTGVALEVIESCDVLASRAQEFLVGRWRRVCIDRLYGLVTDALAILDPIEAAEAVGRAATAETGELEMFSLVDQARKGVESIRGYLAWAAQRLAVLRFLRGVVISAFAVPLVAWILSLVIHKGSEAALWSMGAGAVGATASVLNRVTKNRLQLDYEAGAARLQILGAVRPILGGISGLVLYFAIEGGILPLDPGVEFSRFALLTVLSLAAGFSERFAEDMLAYVGERTGLSGSDRPNDSRNGSSSGQPGDSTADDGPVT